MSKAKGPSKSSRRKAVATEPGAHETWIDELREIENDAGIGSWWTLADRLDALVAHIRAGAPLTRPEDDGS